MRKPRARAFSQVQAEITKTGNQTRKTVREKNTSFERSCDKRKSLPMFATRTAVISPEVELGTTSPSLPDRAQTPSYARAYNNIKTNTLFTQIHGQAHKTTPIQNPQFSGAHPHTALSAGL